MRNGPQRGPFAELWCAAGKNRDQRAIASLALVARVGCCKHAQREHAAEARRFRASHRRGARAKTRGGFRFEVQRYSEITQVLSSENAATVVASPPGLPTAEAVVRGIGRALASKRGGVVLAGDGKLSESTLYGAEHVRRGRRYGDDERGPISVSR